MPRMKQDLWKWAYGAGRLRREVKVYLAGDMVEWKLERLLHVSPDGKGFESALGMAFSQIDVTSSYGHLLPWEV